MFKNRRRIVIFAIAFIILVVTPAVANRAYNLQLEAVSKNPASQNQIFVVHPGQPVAQIAQNLQKENLIKNALAFRLLVSRMDISKNIQAGDFRLSAAMPARQIAQELTHGAIDVWITLPEGLRIEEQAASIEEKLKFAQNDVYRFDKHEYIKTAQEGYMFPDTYLIPKDSSAQQVAEKLRTTFDQKIPAQTLAAGQKNNLNPEQVVILASILEKEARSNEERPVIAGIILNRLKIGMKLDIDATVAYAKGYDSQKKTWWLQVTPDDNKSLKSPYNTYLNPGLPPGPIANPGLEAIMAAVNPATTEYMYYLHDMQGKVHYAKTIQEHNQNIQQFLIK